MKFRKKPVVIDAVQLTIDNVRNNSIRTFLEEAFTGFVCETKDEDEVTIYINTLEGKMKGSTNDWIIKGVKGEFYPCRADIFEATYEPVEDE